MNKYTALKPFATNANNLVINGDILYGSPEENEYTGKILNLFSKTTREYLGQIKANRVEELLHLEK